MKEVKLGRFVGPFQDVPFDNFMQSSVGLVPKANGTDTRLIFHLSFKFKNGNESFNYWTPDELCSVKYCDLDFAVRESIVVSQDCNLDLFYLKTDLQVHSELYRVHLNSGDFFF